MAKTYPVNMTRDQMLELDELLRFVQNHHPFLPRGVRDIQGDVRMILERGCFKHKRLVSQFETDAHRTESICPECNPDRFKELKSKYPERNHWGQLKEKKKNNRKKNKETKK